MTENEFVAIIDGGGDIMFDCGDKHFTICYWTDGPIYIAEQETEANEGDFNSAAELLAQYQVNGIPLKDQIDKIVVTYRT